MRIIVLGVAIWLIASAVGYHRGWKEGMHYEAEGAATVTMACAEKIDSSEFMRQCIEAR